MPDATSRSSQLDRALADLLAQAPEVEAAAVVSFDGLPMASALPATMDEDRVAAMSAALLSLGERAAEGLGRGSLSQVYIEGETGTVFLVSADDEAVLVAVAAKGAKVGMMLYEVRRAADAVAAVLRVAAGEYTIATETPAPLAAVTYTTPSYAEPVVAAAPVVPVAPVETLAQPVAEPVAAPTYAPAAAEPAWPSYLPTGTADPQTWS